MTHVNLYNAERYLDPTAYEALMNICLLYTSPSPRD